MFKRGAVKGTWMGEPSALGIISERPRKPPTVKVDDPNAPLSAGASSGNEGAGADDGDDGEEAVKTYDWSETDDMRRFTCKVLDDYAKKHTYGHEGASTWMARTLSLGEG